MCWHKLADWELLIIDDRSVDNTAQLIKQYNDSHYRYTNAERSAARNNGITHATGQFICFLDSDDEYLPQHLQTFYDFIKAKNFEDAFYYAPSILDTGSKKPQALFTMATNTMQFGHGMRCYKIVVYVYRALF